MSKFACRCGYIMDLSQGTTKYEFALLPESRIEEIAEKMDTEHVPTIDQFYNLIDEVRTTAYRCPQCGRLYLDNGHGEFASYKKEE